MRNCPCDPAGPLRKMSGTGPENAPMSLADAFPAATVRNEPLAPHTHLRIGGPAEFFVRPRSVEELVGVLTSCKSNQVPVRMLGGGYNLLVRDDPVPGAVIRLTGPAFATVERTGSTVRA